MILGEWGTLGVFGAEFPPVLVFDVFNTTNIQYRESGKDAYRATLQVGKTNTYTLTLHDWEGRGDLDSVVVSAPDFTVNSIGYDNDDKALGVLLTGVESGRFPVHFSWTTDDDMSGCMTGYIDVKEC